MVVSETARPISRAYIWHVAVGLQCMSVAFPGHTQFLH